MSAFEATQPDGLTRLTCSLEGVSCAGCIAKIERHISQIEGLVSVRGNATSKRINLVWDNSKTNSAALIEGISGLGYKAHPFDPKALGSLQATLLGPLAVSGFATMNIMAFSFAAWFGIATDMDPQTLKLMHIWSALIATPVVFYCGAEFYGAAYRTMRGGNMTMDAPITIAIFVTYFASLFEMFRGSEDVYFDAVVSLIFFLLIGRVLEQKLRRKSGHTADNLRAMLNVLARRSKPDGTHEWVAADLLQPGDLVTVEATEVFPADGKLLNGPVFVDESALTGESLPSSVAKGGSISAGCTVVEGTAEIQIIHAGNHVELALLAELAENASLHKGQTQLLADRFARSYVPLVLIGGVFGFLLWYIVLGASFGDALLIAVAVFVVTCPCAAGLATPAVSSRAADLLMQQGIVLKSGAALEQLASVSHVFADKTGTLTTARLNVDASDETLQHAAPLAAISRHPLCRALSECYPAPPCSDAREIPGKGVIAESGAKLGSAEFVGVASQDDGPQLWFQNANGATSRIAIVEEPRSGLADFLSGLAAKDIPLTLLSGDRHASVQRFARQNAIKDWKAGLRPEDKFDILQHAEGQTLMLGDGINDAPSLTAASVSASFAGATQVAQSAADIILLHSDPSRLITAMDLAKDTRKLILQNLRFATLYNVFAVPLALAGYLSPLLAAIMMSTSSIFVMANGLRLKERK